MDRVGSLCVSLLGLAPLLASPAPAADYRVSGWFVDAESGDRSRVAGGLSLEALELVLPPTLSVSPVSGGGSFVVTHFAVAAGEHLLLPAAPVEFDGLSSRVVTIADSLVREGNDVPFFRLRSGGDLVEVDGDLVTFRFFELRAQGGRARGHLRGSDHPARFGVEGELVEVRQVFEARRNCTITLPGQDGGVVIRGFLPRALGPDRPVEGHFGAGEAIVIDGLPVISLEDRWSPEAGGELLATELDAGGTLLPAGIILDSNLSSGFAPVRDLGGDVALRAGGAGDFGRRDFAFVEDGAEVGAILDALGIDAPAGVEVLDDGAGSITITTPGDLVVAGGNLEESGLTRLALEAGGDIRIEGSLRLPLAASFEVATAASVVLAEGATISIPEDSGLESPILFDPFCPGLLLRSTPGRLGPDDEQLGVHTLGTLRLEAVHDGSEGRGHDGKPEASAEKARGPK